MTQRFDSWLAPLVAALVLGGCGRSPPPCTSCPQIAGTYSVTFPNGPPHACPGLGVQPGPLVLTQSGAAIQGQYLGQSFSGTLLKTYDLTLITSQAPLMNFMGRYVPAIGDGGAEYTGTFNASQAAGADGGVCTESAAFIAQ